MRQPSYFQTVAASYDDDMDYAEFAAMCDDTDFPDEWDSSMEPDWDNEADGAFEERYERRKEEGKGY